MDPSGAVEGTFAHRSVPYRSEAADASPLPADSWLRERRRTLATWLGSRGNRVYLGLLTVADPVVAAITVGCSALPWWPAPVLPPVLMARARRAYGLHVTGDAHAASAHYWRLYRLGGLALTVANTAGHLPAWLL